MRPWVWVSSALAPLFLIGGWTLAQTRQPARYDAVRDTISALAARGATDRWIMTAGLAGLGACHLITVAGWSAPGRLARGVLAAGGVATIGVAAAPQPSDLHGPIATVAFLALALWPAFMSRAGRWVTLALLILLAAFSIAMAAGTGVGLSERLLAGAEALAPLGFVVASRLTRATQQVR